MTIPMMKSKTKLESKNHNKQYKQFKKNIRNTNFNNNNKSNNKSNKKKKKYNHNTENIRTLKIKSACVNYRASHWITENQQHVNNESFIDAQAELLQQTTPSLNRSDPDSSERAWSHASES